MKRNMVSIIIPVYNGESVISKCINSVLNQTYENIEVIVVNDGSTDNTANILDRLKRENRNIRVIHQENRGPSIARNMGLKESKGEFIQFVDSDDILMKNATEVLLKKKGFADLVIAGIKETSDNNSIKVLEAEVEEVYETSQFVEVFHELFNKKLINSPCNKLYKKSLITKFDISFPTNIDNGEDLYFNLQYFKVCSYISVVKDVIYEYRKFDDNSLTLNFKKDYLENRIYIFESLTTFFNEMKWLNKTSIKELKEKIFTMYSVQILENIVRNPSFNSKDMRQQIHKTINHKFYRNNLDLLKAYNYQTKIIILFINKKLTSFIYLYFRLKKILRENFSFLFKTLKSLNKNIFSK